MDISLPVAERVLRVAAQVGQGAPSILDTQPWRWQIDASSLELWADRSRQLHVADPHGRLLTISCGAALHHAKLALAVLGHDAIAFRCPDAAAPDCFATIRLTGRHHVPSNAERALYAAIAQRRAERRTCSARPVDRADAHALVDAVDKAGAQLHLLGASSLAHEMHGSPPTTASTVSYAVVVTEYDESDDWLQAGEALSALVLTATSVGLATAPAAAALTRERLQRMLSGPGHAQLAVRIGHPSPR